VTIKQANRELYQFPGRLILRTYKELTDNKKSLKSPFPDKIILPLQQHIGMPNKIKIK